VPATTAPLRATTRLLNPRGSWIPLPSGASSLPYGPRSRLPGDADASRHSDPPIAAVALPASATRRSYADP
jgi:hypothetical protein